MKKYLLILVFFVNSLNAFAKDTVDRLSYPEDRFIILSTGDAKGVYYAIGESICRAINRTNNSTKCSVELSSGSIENLERLRRGEVDLAIAQSDLVNKAFNGIEPFSSDDRMEQLRFLTSLYDEAFTLLVRRDSDIKKIDDLSKKTVNIGLIDSSIRATVDTILVAKNWTYRNFKNIEELELSEQGEALCNGKVDAIFLAIGHPNAIMQDLLNKCEMRAINLYDDQIHKFVNNNPQYAKVNVSNDLYRGLNSDINTFGPKAILVTSTDLTENMGYFITKAIYDSIRYLQSYEVMNNVDIKAMEKEGRVIPLHIGAEKFYREKDK